jgi:hypothetical protein
VLAAKINSETIAKPNWNRMMEHVILLAAKKLKNVDALCKMVLAKHVKAEKTDQGFDYFPLRIAQPIRLSVQQGVQRLLHAAAHHAVEVALDPLIVNRDDIAQSTRCIVGYGGFLLLTWLF